MEAHVYNNLFLRWDFTFQVTRAIKLPISERLTCFSSPVVKKTGIYTTICMSILGVAITKLLKKKTAIQIDKNRDRYIDRLSADSRPKYRTAIFWLSTKCRPTIDRVLTNYWLIHQSRIDQLSAKCPRKVGEVSVKYRCTKSFIGRDTSGTTIDRLSTVSRPSVDRLSTVISTECRPTIDRYIDRLIGRHSLQ